MDIDREYQLELLKRLRDAHPRPLSDFSFLDDQDENATERYAANMKYLEGHGLAIGRIVVGMDGYISLGAPEITSQGIDFLQDDGGIGAILGIVTIRLHSDTIKDLIEAKIAQSDLAPADKKRWIDQLRSLPADATKHLVQKLVEKGLDSGPAAVAAIGAYLKSQGLW